MKTVNIQEAKAQFSKLIDAVAQGEEIMIAKAGKPTAMLVPIQEHHSVRRPGTMKGEIQIAEDFDAPLPDVLQARFEGR